MQINLENLPQLAQDKANHHIYGEAAALVGAVLLPWAAALLGFHLEQWQGAVIGAAGAGLAKETWDYASGKGDPSVGDFVATASGALGVCAALAIGAGLPQISRGAA